MKTFRYYGPSVCFYLYYYLKSHDYISTELLRFKNNASLQVNTFSNIAADYFKKSSNKFDYIVRALGSTETIAQKNKPLGALCRSIATITNTTYNPIFLKKEKVTDPLKAMNRNERKKALENVYSINQNIDMNGKRILIVDDITTTGTSLSVITQCILSKYKPATISAFCLAKTVSLDFDNISENEADKVAEYNMFKQKVSL